MATVRSANHSWIDYHTKPCIYSFDMFTSMMSKIEPLDNLVYSLYVEHFYYDLKSHRKK